MHFKKEKDMKERIRVWQEQIHHLADYLLFFLSIPFSLFLFHLSRVHTHAYVYNTNTYIYIYMMECCMWESEKKNK